MTVQINDVIRITAVMDSSLEGTVQNVFHAKMTVGTASDAAFISATRTAFDTAYDNIDGIMPDTLSFDEIRFFNVTQDLPMSPTTWPTLTVGGVDVADPLPSPMSCLVFGRTGTSRRIFKKYFAPFTEANHADAEWDTSPGSQSLLLVASLTAGWAAGAGSAYVGLWSPTDLLFYDIVELVSRTVPAYQRRRRRGRGA